MINIRPVSDLRNKYPEIEKLVLKGDETVYLTKNGRESMVVMSINKYDKLITNLGLSEKEEKDMEAVFGNVDIEKLLDESEEAIDNPNTKFLTHEEIMSRVRRLMDEKK